MTSDSELRELLSLHGEVASQGPDGWRGPYSLPEPVLEFYRSIGPVSINIEGYGNPYYLPSLAELSDFQVGYRVDGNTGERLGDWLDSWTVVADEAGDPFIFDASSGKVLLAVHGQGSWDPYPLFPDLRTMAGSLAAIGRVVVDAGADLCDDDCFIQEQHLEAALKHVQSFLGSETKALEVLSILGWSED